MESPVVVIGDRSGSMEVAIRTSTIIASLLTAICSAKLVFFDDKNMEAPFIPTNIEEVLEMAVTINTGGCTAPAACLWPIYSKKEVVKTFIMVTDEEENAPFEGYRFAPLFKKYREEVYQARLVFVSFLRSQHAEGQMVRELHQAGVTENVMHFNFNQNKPDLTKLDKLFGLLSSETDDFEEKVKAKEDDIRADGVNKVLQGLNIEGGEEAMEQGTKGGKVDDNPKPADSQGASTQAQCAATNSANSGTVQAPAVPEVKPADKGAAGDAAKPPLVVQLD